MQNPDFWRETAKAQAQAEELGNLKTEIKDWEELNFDLEHWGELTPEEQSQIYPVLEKRVKSFRLKTLLSGSYDRGPALLEIFSGAGGVDAQDWSSLLLRMYQRYASDQNFSFKILHQSWGEQGGTKSAIAEIRGAFAYGYLKKEAGVHRLVRISPFSAKNLRHTSFALVEFLPLVEQKLDLKIKPEDLRIETFRSSGPGGQNVNKVETAVRVTHLPTGLAVAVQSERSQGQNKEKALAVLYSRLWQKLEEQKLTELAQLKSLTEPGSIEWGSQIRSYVLHPYKLVKDHRTGWESHHPEGVLEGNLDEFIEAELNL